MLKFGMIGCGGHATNAIYPALRYADLRLVAVCDLDPELAERNGRIFGAAKVYNNHLEMLEKEDLDAVGVVGPPRMHADIGIQVLESGRHLFIEKPPGDTLEAALGLQQAARSAGKQMMVGFMKRHALTYQRAKEISRRPDFGEPTMLRLNYSHWNYPPLREHLIFMSTHPLDLCRFFLGDVVGGSVFKREIDNNNVVALLLEHETGAVSNLTLSAFEPRVQEYVELAGRSTLIQVQNLIELRSFKAAPGIMEAWETDETMVGLWYPELTIPFNNSNSFFLQGYAGQMKHFAEAIQDGTPVSPNIDDGVEAMRLVEAIISAPQGVSALNIPAI